MSIIFSTFIPTMPKTKARPRLTRSGHAYTPKSTADAELLIKLAVARQWRQKPVTGALSLMLRVYLPKPKRSKMTYPKGDTDNFLKLVLDSLNNLVYVDDTQVVSVFAHKQYCNNEAPEPGYQITVVREGGI